MRELAQHVTDLLENSVRAGAHRVEIEMDERRDEDLLTLTVHDDGSGMPPEVVTKVTDPFFTSRTCRRVGLGVPLLAASAARSGGRLRIESQVGKGTKVIVTFRLSNIDTPPLGDMASTVLCGIIGHQDVDVCFRRCVDGRRFEVDSAAIRRELDGVPLTHPPVLRWLEQLVADVVAAVPTAACEEETHA